MPRYFIETAYKGTHFKGFQAQLNAISIQGEINKALQTILKDEIQTTTSSRTDAGVHALQNFLHFDTEQPLPSSIVYNLNSILHEDILINRLMQVKDTAHARFDAIARDYTYHIVSRKQPFLRETAYFVPFPLDMGAMNEAAAILPTHKHFESFCKRNTDVKTFECRISSSFLEKKGEEIIYHVRSNRFLRGMVRAIIGTLILVGRKKISCNQFEEIIGSNDCSRADFSAPAHGLFLERVHYPDLFFEDTQKEKI
nr:tRNA pseudouridine(38-40) synthase TruA [Chitinophagaceae bacterium]